MSTTYSSDSQNCTFLIWRSQIERHLLSLDVPFDPEWWKSQRRRLAMMYDTGEQVEMAKEAMEMFFRGNHNSKVNGSLNPLDPRICKGVTLV